MATATQPVQERPNTLAGRCPKALRAKRVTGPLSARYALVSCPDTDGIRHVRMFLDRDKRFQAAMLWRRSGCVVPGCYGQCDHPCLDFDELSYGNKETNP